MQGDSTQHVDCYSGTKKDETFTKPAVPAQKLSGISRADKLADQYLNTGESTRELIALGDTPVLKTKTRSATAAVSQDQPRAITIDKPSKQCVYSYITYRLIVDIY